MTGKKTAVFILISVAIIVLGLAAIGAMFNSRFTSTVMTKRSPDRQHTAKLERKELIDVNFTVSVDGRVVYGSPDFQPVNADFREQLIWDTNSERVLLEVAGERIFGYDIKEKRPLFGAELRQFSFTSFQELHFEGAIQRNTNALTNSSSPAHTPAP